MALARAAGLCRLALRTQWAAVRLLASTAAGDELRSGDEKTRQADLEALRRERARRPPPERPRLAPPRKVYSTPKPSLEQLQLNKEILACESYAAVLDLVTPRLDSLSGVNVATALLTLARRARLSKASARLSRDARLAQLLRAAESLFGCMESRELSNALYACGQLGVTPPPDWLPRFWRASALKLGDFKPQELSNTLYASGRLGIAPPASWLQRYWEASALKLDEFKPQELSNTLYASGQLGITPPADWLPRYWHTSASKLSEFKPQELSNTLYACGQLSITPTSDWWLRFWHTSASKLGEFKTQELNNTFYACGQLRIVPPADWLLRFWDASSAKLGDFKPQELSNTLYACATLDVAPPADWLQRFSHSCARALPDTLPQDVANVVLALTMLALWDLPLLPSLFERLCCSLSHNIAGWSAEDWQHAHQLYQVYQVAAVERPGLLAKPSPELLAAIRRRKAEEISAHGARTSNFHADVSACLMRMGIPHTNELWCERAERKVDIAIESTPPVALEVDGPHHFLQDGRQDGGTLLRNRMLAAHGWRVAVVDYRLWDGPKTQKQREEYLRRVLEA